MDRDTVIRQIRAQERSTAMWVEQHQQNKDRSSMLNAMFALGKLSSLISLLSAKGEDTPEDILQIQSTYGKVFDEILRNVF